MKIMHLKRICFTIAASAALLGTANRSSAQPLDDTIDYVNAFDDAASVGSWIYWYGNGFANNPMTWDSSKDASSNVNSGSLLFDTVFPASDQGAWFGTFGNRYGYDTGFKHNAAKYTNIVFDILVDPTSVLSQAGTFGNLQIGFYDGPNQIGSQIIPASATNGWVRIVQPINPATENIGAVSGIAFRIQTYDNFNNPVGHLKFWMDNLKMVVSPVELPPPTLSSTFTDADPGLNLFSASGGGEFQRSSIKRIDQNGLGFIGQSGVTYSFTIKKFPDPDLYPNYQAHIFLATGPGNASSLDYNETNLIWLNVQGTAGGGATAYFRYKINEGGANSNLFGAEYTVGPVGTAWAGQLTNVSAATPVGTWSMTFNQDTNVTLNGPGGVSTSFSIRPEVAAAFTGPLNLVFGAQPNRYSEAEPLRNVGQKVVLSDARATNSGAGTSIIYDNFLAGSTLDTTKWSILAGSPNTVYVFPNDPGQKIVKWSLPDTGFYLQISTNLGSPWHSLVGNLSFAASGFRNALVPSSALGLNQNFFRLIKRAFTQLQVLLPGETAAPGTPTGKTGTPTPQQAGAAFDVVVKAVDADWFPITLVPDQQINLSSTDPAFTWPGFPGTMVNGQIIFDAATWNLSLGTVGNQTITATDTTDNTKTPGTSSPVTVTPP